MKKFLLILLIACLTSSLAYAKDTQEQFVNPTFYKPMINFSKQPKLIKITPTRYYIENCFGYKAAAECELLENTQNSVTLKCIHQPEDKNDKQALIITGYDNAPQTWTYKFYILPLKEQDNKQGTYIRRLAFYNNEQEASSYTGFLAYNSLKKQQEYWQSILNAFKEKR